MIAMVLGSSFFLNLATEGDIVGNSLFLNKMIPITVLSWLFQLLTFNCIESMNCLVCIFSQQLEVFFDAKGFMARLHIYFNDDVLYFFGSKQIYFN
jgi:putative colanic acid biosynthesis UDP-glucose lipid carrier transferase